MKTTFLAKAAIAAAATMITLTPALAADKRHYKDSYRIERDGYQGRDYRDRRDHRWGRHDHADRHDWRGRWGQRYWYPRRFGWNYGHSPYRRWW